MSLGWQSSVRNRASRSHSLTQRRHITSLDAKWLEKWDASSKETGSTEYGPETTDKSPRYYQSAMIPYPSGRSHIGHSRVYTISDTLARYRRMNGYKVRHPIGWDAFGLPAENAAIENKVSAKNWTYNHIDVMRAQSKRMMVSFDWDEEIITCSPEYYKHTQRIFLESFKHGLAYRQRASVNWDPVDQTVLANEQIDSEGRSWRSGALAEKRDLEQWFLKITDFAPQLVKDLNLSKEWPEKVKTMQRNWIGISKGARVKFSDELWAFTTRSDTLPGVKFVAIALEHPLAKAHAADMQPSGLIEGLEATNPLTNEPLPVYAADYVVSDYAEGVVMGVPAHDERDRSFWEKVRPVSEPEEPEPVVDDKTRTVINGPQDSVGLKIKDAQHKVMEKSQSEDKGRFEKQTRLRDWSISRQRFWGAPIPIVHCDSCGIVPVPEEASPVKSPENTSNDNVPLSQNKEWSQTTCPKCGNEHAHRDPDTMDTFMDSSWYYFRNSDAHNPNDPFAYDKVSHGNMPVDFYIGGIEHAISHSSFSRFLAKFLYKDVNMWDGGSMNGEPFKQLVTSGMVHGKAYREAKTGRYLKPEEVAVMPNEDIIESVEKMSKSKYNGADPLEVIEEYGADVVRAHMLFQAGVTDTLVWDIDKIVGIKRWMGRIAQIGEDSTVDYEKTKADNRPDHERDPKAIEHFNHAVFLVNRVGVKMGRTLSSNTSISDEMKLTRVIDDLAEIDKRSASQAYEALLKILAPICPAHAEEFWESSCRRTGREYTSIHKQAWPKLTNTGVPDDGKVQFRVISNGEHKFLRAPESATSQESSNQSNIDRGSAKRVVFKPQMKSISIVS